MPKPKQVRDADKTRAAILSASTQLFAEKGFIGASISDIHLIVRYKPQNAFTLSTQGGDIGRVEAGRSEGAFFGLPPHRDTRLVTVTVGANDVRTCLAGGGVDYRCAWRELGNVGRNLEVILGAVRREAPQARIVVLD